MKKKEIFAISIGILSIAFLYYVFCPLVFIRDKITELNDGDFENLVDSIDIDNFREDIKDQLKTAISTKLGEDEEMQKNPFAQVGAAIGFKIVDAMVDSKINRYNLIKELSNSHKDIIYRVGIIDTLRRSKFRYRTINNFVLRLYNKEKREDDYLELNMLRVGLFGWKIKNIRIPQSILTDIFKNKN